MAYRLREAGITDFSILERAADLGGTWRDNSYPGCACDVRSALYSFAFAPNPDWSEQFAGADEIWRYLRAVAERLDLTRHIAYGEELRDARWDDSAKRWTVTTPTGEWRAQHLVVATGALSEPAMPDIAGLETFAGPIFHSARWDHGVDLRGKRVAVIGTGASAIQFVPRIQPEVARLDVYQRTPPWILPRLNRPVPAWRKRLYRDIPETLDLTRGALYWLHEALHAPFRHPWMGRVAEAIARLHLRFQVRDASLRRRLTPKYAVGCKRVLFADDYYPALSQPNVELVTDPIVEVVAEGVVTRIPESVDEETPKGIGSAPARKATGLRKADVIILGSGFLVTEPPVAQRLTGRDGRTLADIWNGSPQAYRGTMVHGFPNLYLLLGPNTALGHSSVVMMAESQAEQVMGLLRLAGERGAAAVEPTAEAQASYVRWVDAANLKTVWARGGCASWYIDRTGRISTLWPFGVGRFDRMMREVVAGDFSFATR